MAGLLYVVSTPIGNLEDITYRAVNALKAADWIACEDTRTTHRLLAHYGITTRSLSYHEHNELERPTELTARLLAGDTGALVSDAGTPLLSDPGYRLVRAAVEAGVRVEALPGAVRASRRAGGLGIALRSVSLRRIPAVETGRAHASARSAAAKRPRP